MVMTMLSDSAAAPAARPSVRRRVSSERLATARAHSRSRSAREVVQLAGMRDRDQRQNARRSGMPSAVRTPLHRNRPLDARTAPARPPASSRFSERQPAVQQVVLLALTICGPPRISRAARSGTGAALGVGVAARRASRAQRQRGRLTRHDEAPRLAVAVRRRPAGRFQQQLERGIRQRVGREAATAEALADDGQQVVRR